MKGLLWLLAGVVLCHASVIRRTSLTSDEYLSGFVGQFDDSAVRALNGLISGYQEVTLNAEYDLGKLRFQQDRLSLASVDNPDEIEDGAMPLELSHEELVGDLSVCSNGASDVELQCRMAEGALEIMDSAHDLIFGLDDLGTTTEFEEMPSVTEVELRSFVVGSEIGSGMSKTVYHGTYGRRAVAISLSTPRARHSSVDGRAERDWKLAHALRETIINRRYACRSFIPEVIAFHKVMHRGEVVKYYVISELAEGDLEGVSFAGKGRSEALGAALQLAYGLKCVQQAGYIHRDFRPANVLRAKDRPFYLINDFGVTVKKTDRDAQRKCGHPDYKPGEPASESGDLYDVYALGLTYRALHLAEFLVGVVDVDLMASKDDYSRRPPLDTIISRIVDEVMRPFREDTLPKAVAGMEALQAELEAKENELLTHTKRQTELLSHIGTPSELRNRLEELTRQVDRAVAEVAAHDRDVARLQRDLDAAQEDLRLAKLAYDDIERPITARRRDRQAVMDELAAAKKRTEATAEEHRKIESIAVDDTDHVFRKLGRLLNINGTVTSADKRERLRTSSGELRRLREQEAAIQERIRLANDQVQAAKRKLRDALSEGRRKVTTAEARITSVTKQREDILASRAAAQSRVDEVKTLLDEKRRALANQEEFRRQLEEVRTLLARVTEARNTVRRSLDASAETVASLKTLGEEVAARLKLERSPETAVVALMKDELFVLRPSEGRRPRHR